MNEKALLLTMPLIFSAALCSGEINAKPKRPNVILIHADDLGKGMLSSYGQKLFTTPNIDRLVNEGLKFENAYSSAYSAPARASLLTGYNDCRNDKIKLTDGGMWFGARDTTIIAGCEKLIDDKDLLYDKNDLCMAQVFKQAGYKTFAVGKLEWGFTATRKQMKARGWDNYIGFLDHIRCRGYYPPFVFEDGAILMIEENRRADGAASITRDSPEATASRWNMEGKGLYSEDLFVDRICTYIEDNKDDPFFIYYPTCLPHGPIAIPSVHPELLAVHHLTQIEKEFGSMIKRLDYNVGLILDQLERSDLLDDTIVIFLADNGHNIYYPQIGRTAGNFNPITNERFDNFDTKFNTVSGGDQFNGNGSTSGLKGSNFDGGVNVAMSYYWRGHIEPGVTKELAANYDILPTMAELLNVKLKVEKSGSSYLSLLLDGTPRPKDKYLIADSSQGGPMIVNNEGWKLKYFHPRKAFQLFNLEADPMELVNLIESYPEIAEKLKTQLVDECQVGYARETFIVRNEELYQKSLIEPLQGKVVGVVKPVH